MIPNSIKAAMRVKAAIVITRMVREGIDLHDIDPLLVAEEIDRIALDKTSAPAVECSDAAYEAASQVLRDRLDRYYD